MKNIEVTELPNTSAEALYWKFLHDETLPRMKDFKKMARDPSLIPAELRVHDLVFPKVIFPGLSEGGDAYKVTDNSIGLLVWDGTKWLESSLLAGKDGWGRTGPDYCGPRARLVRFKN